MSNSLPCEVYWNETNSSRTDDFRLYRRMMKYSSCRRRSSTISFFPLAWAVIIYISPWMYHHYYPTTTSGSSYPPYFAIAFASASTSSNSKQPFWVSRAMTSNTFMATTTTPTSSSVLLAVDDEKEEEEEYHEEETPVMIPTDFIAETNLPTDMGAYRLRAYRVSSTTNSKDTYATYNVDHFGKEPCVIYYADKPPGTLGGFNGGANGSASTPFVHGVPIRIHDQCFTSEVFRSQRCDCREQLQMALRYIQEHGGAIIYLQQEGRGIGLANKVAAYALQDNGMDTVDANLHLGFPEDARQYGMVPSILQNMGIQSIQLMSNNPRKMRRLRALGVTIDDVIPMVIPKANHYNRKYLETKVIRMNHTDIGTMLQLQPDYATSTHLTSTTIDAAAAAKSPLQFQQLQPQQHVRKNGIMTPLKSTTGITKSQPTTQQNTLQQQQQQHSKTWIYEGTTKAAKAVTQALLDDHPHQTGVAAREDGYCFGRQSVEDAIAAVQRGEMVVVVDDENRENEGDFIIPGSKVTPEVMATMIRYSSGVICVALESERMEELDIAPMVKVNQDPKGTAFGISVDAAHGISTGISAKDRAITIQLLADPRTTAKDLVRPGHIFPLRSRAGGTLTRDGHTEASVDLSKLAGLYPCGVLCEIVSEENPVEMARLPELKRFCKKYGYTLTSIVDIAQYRRELLQQQEQQQQTEQQQQIPTTTESSQDIIIT